MCWWTRKQRAGSRALCVYTVFFLCITPLSSPKLMIRFAERLAIRHCQPQSSARSSRDSGAAHCRRRFQRRPRIRRDERRHCSKNATNRSRSAPRHVFKTRQTSVDAAAIRRAWGGQTGLTEWQTDDVGQGRLTVLGAGVRKR
jgi:hypothetical protein